MISPGTGRRVALVEDSAVQRQILGGFLRDLGLEVELAETADEALELLVRGRPDAVLSDLVLPGIDGFALCRTIKDDPRLAEIPVVLLTSTQIDDSDRELARRSGAEVLVSRTPGFAAIAEATLAAVERRGTGSGTSDPGGADPVLADLRERFLLEGREAVRDLLARWDEEPFDLEEVRSLVHRWAGRGGTLGFPAIGRRAREVERRLAAGEMDAARSVLVTLGQLLAGPGEPPEDAPADRRPPEVAAHVLEALHDRHVALIGFTSAEAERLAGVLSRARARARSVEWTDALLTGRGLDPYDLLVLAAHGEPAWSPWLASEAMEAYETPLLLVGGPEMLIREPPRGASHHLLLAPWTPEGLLLRAWLAIRSESARPRARRDPEAPPDIVLADDDPTIVALVGATLRNSGFRCHVAEDGGEALDLARRVRPSAMIVDINMPRRDGYEVLAEMKTNRHSRAVPVMLLTARQQEADIIRGFELGAAEYIVKPFNPMELVARLRRLLA